MHGKFVISLDFELLWGVRDKKTIESYGENIKGVHEAIPGMLEIFDKYGVNATFATVGFLFLETKEEFLNSIPSHIPNYTNKKLSPYTDEINLMGENYKVDPYHFGPHLIKQIQKYPKQEIGSHTYSHYYCLEEGQTINDFRADMQTAQSVAGRYGIKLSSLVFPRNQFNNEYIEVCKDLGFICVRGNEHSWLYEARSRENESKFRRALRFIDAYINISGYHCYSDEYLKSKFPVDVPASRFLRPYSKKLKIFEKLRLSRIKSAMTYAAKKGLTYHLWWHPHNFGVNRDENFNFLEKILTHYQLLNKQYGFTSYTMSELANKMRNEK